MTIQEILHKTYSAYKLSPLDAGILLSLVITKPKEFILAHPEKKLAPAQIKKYFSFAKRRAKGEPIAYITGKKEFFELDFVVNKNVLIPRPETELLVEFALEKIQAKKYDAVIDVGTGSGSIIISIAKNIPEKIRKKIKFFAVDISKESLQVAKSNAKRYKMDGKINFVQSNLLEYYLNNKIAQKNILVIANLPYVSPEIYQKNKNNLRFEPKSALVSRQKGLSHYKKLLAQVNLLITDHCSLFIEISPEQKPEIGRIIKEYLPKARARFLKDLAGKWRIMGIEITP